MAKYIVLSPLEHDQKRYEPGKMAELTDEQAEPLLALNVVSPSVAEKSSTSTAAQLIEQIEACSTVAEIDAVVGIDTRKTVLDAAEKRKAILAAPQE